MLFSNAVRRFTNAIGECQMPNFIKSNDTTTGMEAIRMGKFHSGRKSRARTNRCDRPPTSSHSRWEWSRPGPTKMAKQDLLSGPEHRT